MGKQKNIDKIVICGIINKSDLRVKDSACVNQSPTRF